VHFLIAVIQYKSVYSHLFAVYICLEMQSCPMQINLEYYQVSAVGVHTRPPLGSDVTFSVLANAVAQYDTDA